MADSASVAETLCSVCKLKVKDESKVFMCSGICNYITHMECSGFNKTECKLIENKNFLWFCDKCKFIGTNVSNLLASLTNAVISCQNHIVKQSITIKEQNAEFALLKSEVALIKKEILASKKSTEHDMPLNGLEEVDKLSYPADTAAKNQRVISFPKNILRDLGNPKAVQRGNVIDSKNPSKKPVDGKKSTVDSDRDVKSSSGKTNKSWDYNITANTSRDFTFSQPKPRRDWSELEEESSGPENENGQGDDFTTVISRKRRNRSRKRVNTNAIMGTIVMDEQESFASVPKIKKAWIYVGNTKKGTNEEKIRDYIKTKAPMVADVNVDKLNCQGETQSFRVSVSFEHKDVIMNGDLWPNGVVIRRYNFSKKNFWQNRQTEVTT